MNNYWKKIPNSKEIKKMKIKYSACKHLWNGMINNISGAIFPPSNFIVLFCMIVFVNLTLPKVKWEEETLTEE